MKYKLYKQSEHGEWIFLNSGPAWTSGRPDGEEPPVQEIVYPGWAVSCGSLSSRDWWTTTIVKEVIKSTSYETIFKTNNSVYKLEAIMY